MAKYRGESGCKRMYTPSSLMEALAVFPDLAAELVDVECGTYCTEIEVDCFEGPALRLTPLGFEVVLVALWSHLYSTAPDYAGQCHIYVVPETDGFESHLHGWFTGAQRVGGRPFGIGPDFLNLEHRDEWENYFSGLRKEDAALSGLSVPPDLAELEGLPRMVYRYTRELVALHEATKPKSVCPSCFDPTCPAGADRGAECVNTEVL